MILGKLKKDYHQSFKVKTNKKRQKSLIRLTIENAENNGTCIAEHCRMTL